MGSCIPGAVPGLWDWSVLGILQGHPEGRGRSWSSRSSPTRMLGQTFSSSSPVPQFPSLIRARGDPQAGTTRTNPTPVARLCRPELPLGARQAHNVACVCAVRSLAPAILSFYFYPASPSCWHLPSRGCGPLPAAPFSSGPRRGRLCPGQGCSPCRGHC